MIGEDQCWCCGRPAAHLLPIPVDGAKRWLCPPCLSRSITPPRAGAVPRGAAAARHRATETSGLQEERR